MKKIFDFLYYFMYQLNRRGYRSGNYDSARFALAFIIFVSIIFLSKIIDPLIEYFFQLKIPYNYWGIFSLTFGGIFTYYFTNKFYGPNGSRKWVVSYYDKNTTLKKQNSVIQVVILTFLIMSFFLICYISGIRLRRYFGLYVPE
jgi:predicted histidine transporter YuiF (NhaC family)